MLGFLVTMLILALVANTLFARVRALEEKLDRLEKNLRARLPQGERPRADAPAVPAAPQPAPPEGGRAIGPGTESVAIPLGPQPAPKGAPKSTPRPPPIVARAEPDPVTIFFGKVKAYFTTGNVPVKVGMVLIFFGVSFLLKYAIDTGLLPIEVRLVASAAFGVGLVRVGWQLRSRAREFGLVLQGGGIGLLMLVTFVALKSYGLISAPVAFLLLVAYTVAAATLAVRQDSLNLAAFGVLGGFLAPVLASTGQGQHVILFSYYAILNLGILAISWEKAWRELNLLGFFFTFVIGTAWGVTKYDPIFYASTQPFLILFFLIYVAIPLLFAQRRAPELKGYVDGTIIFGNSIATLALQLELVKPYPYAGAYSALALAAFYILLSNYLLKHRNAHYRTLSEAFISIGIVFVTVAVPLAFDGLKTSATWAFEAAGIYWVSLRQNRPLARFFSTALLFGTSIAFFLGPTRGASDLLFLNTFFFSCVFMTAGAYAVSYLGGVHRAKLSWLEKAVPELAFAMGTAWWVYGGLFEIDRFTFPWWNALGVPAGPQWIPTEFLARAQLAYLTVGSLVMLALGVRLPWRKALLLAHAFVLVLLAFGLRAMGDQDPFASYGWAAWMFAFGAYVLVLKAGEAVWPEPRGKFFRFGHAGLLWALTGVITLEVSHLANVHLPPEGWALAVKGLPLLWAIWLVARNRGVFPWPLERHARVYLTWGLVPLVACTLLWVMITNWTNAGGAAPLPYVPLLNPLELVHAALLLAVGTWAFDLLESAKGESRRLAAVVIGGVIFFWLNGALCRAVHHYAGVAFHFDALWDSVVVQVALSLYWTVLGIALMLFASRRAWRWLWLTGAGLLGVVVLKMFLVDLSKTDTIARVVSFLGVGVLFLVVGYFSPIPPKLTGEKNA